ncbi:MAG: dipeptide epimerase [Balneolales bacterium]
MTVFSIDIEPLNLPMKRTFTISRGSREHVNNVLIRLHAEGVTGIGEAAPNHRYSETQQSAMNFLEKTGNYKSENPFDVDELVRYMEQSEPGEYAAKAGLEMALYDWIGKKLNLPLYKLLRAPARTGPPTTFTLGIDEPDQMKEKVEEAGPYPLLKVKLGTDHDKEIITAIREHTSKPLMVDVNEGWKSMDQALDMIRFLHKQNVYAVEQPLPADCKKEMQTLRLKSNIPLFADESMAGREPLQELATQFHGINIKLMKTGAISTSLQIIHEARKEGLQIMAGCMVESVIADTASALVALWADFADLDGHLLVLNNTFEGLEILPSGHVQVKEIPGLGLSEAVF